MPLNRDDAIKVVIANVATSHHFERKDRILAILWMILSMVCLLGAVVAAESVAATVINGLCCLIYLFFAAVEADSSIKWKATKDDGLRLIRALRGNHFA